LLDVYNQEPEAVITIWTTLLNEITYLRSRVEKLEAQVKKTPKTATNHLLPMSSISRNQKAFGKKQEENLKHKKVMSVIR
jgi:hypothetical protein